ncbi:hypothetical protein SAY87_010209 [Trapa incisa]|uniref:Uncharacterized protein n=1 Tax=Trapa incisa TaxID=236973 RepID=A0AAN7GQ63_9MYRT|nr:hypothetical protein SAY87_010209 [Trapa incisa]
MLQTAKLCIHMTLSFPTEADGHNQLVVKRVRPSRSHPLPNSINWVCLRFNPLVSCDIEVCRELLPKSGVEFSCWRLDRYFSSCDDTSATCQVSRDYKGAY